MMESVKVEEGTLCLVAMDMLDAVQLMWLAKDDRLKDKFMQDGEYVIFYIGDKLRGEMEGTLK